MDVGKALVPAVALDPIDLALFGRLDHLRGHVWVTVVGFEFRNGAGHRLDQQFITQAGGVLGAAVGRHPVEERAAVQFGAVAVVAAVRTHGGVIAALRSAVGMLGMVGADDAGPALTVRAAQDQAIVGQPGHHVVVTVVGQFDRPVGGARLARHHAQGVADLRQGELPLRVELDQARDEALTAGLQVYAARQPEVTHRVDRASVGVAGVGDGRDGRAEVGLGRLHLGEGVAPLEVAGACLHDPSRGQGRRLALRADVVEHQHQDVFAVGGRGARALAHAVNDEAGGIAVPRLAFTPSRRGQKRRPGAFGQPIGVRPGLRLLPDNQKSLALRRQTRYILQKFHRVLLGICARPYPPGVFICRSGS